MIVDCAVYEEDGTRRDGATSVKSAFAACHEPGAFVWIGMHEPTAEEFDSIAREFELHELAVEDAIKAHQRPKIERYDDMVFAVLKPVHYVDSEEVINVGEIAAFLGRGYIITVRHGKATDLHPIRLDLERDPARLRHGPSAVFHAILDRVVDDYLPALRGLEEDVDEVEREVFSSTRSNPAERIYKLKRETLEFSRAVSPLVDPADRLARGQIEMGDAEITTYYRDVADHLVRVNDALENVRDLLSSVLDANLAQVSVRQNEDVRKISAWVAIIAVPTMIAGVYGMNFENMPELKWDLGYPMALLVMVTACSLLYRSFKRAGWL